MDQFGIDSLHRGCQRDVILVVSATFDMVNWDRCPLIGKDTPMIREAGAELPIS
jgi:hypothetical protein